MTTVLTVSVILFGVLSYLRLPVNDLPAVDYPVIQVQADYPGASPETVANNIATPLERQFMQINGLELVTSKSTQGPHQPHAPVRSEQKHRRRGHRRADRDLAGHRQPAGGFAVAADVFQDQSQRSADHVYRADQRFGDARPALRLRQHANRPADQHLAGRIPGECLRHQIGHSHQGRSFGDVGARYFHRRSVRGGQERHELHRRGTIRRARAARRCLRPQGQLDSAQAYSDLIVGSTNGAPVYLRDVAKVRDSVQDERLNMRFWARGYPVPGATVVLAVFRQAGANAVEVANSIRGRAAARSAPSCRDRCASRRSTTARAAS